MKIITFLLKLILCGVSLRFSAYFCATIKDKVYGNRTYIDCRR